MRTLYLHIGHGKTGSSFIQSALARSSETLNSHGISYPMAAADRKLGLAGSISTGNAWGALESVERIGRWLDEHDVGSDKHVLLSSESLFDELHIMLHHEPVQIHPDRLADVLKSKGFGRARILLYVRDPQDFYASAWQQFIKRGGETRPIEALEQDIGFRYVKATAQILATLEGQTFFDLTLVNYTRTPDVLVPFARWLGVAVDQLDTPPVKVINRSLTRSELEFVRSFNDELTQRHLGFLPASFLSDTLCNDLPHIKAEHAALPRDLADRLWLDAGPAIAVINANLPPDAGIVRTQEEAPDPHLPHVAGAYCFSAQQIKAITKFMSGQIASFADQVTAAQQSLEAIKSHDSGLADALAAERTRHRDGITALEAQMDILNFEHDLAKTERDAARAEVALARSAIQTAISERDAALVQAETLVQERDAARTALAAAKAEHERLRHPIRTFLADARRKMGLGDRGR